MKRLFIGIGFSKELQDYFKESQLMIEKHCESARYTRYENFHLTLKFLGMMNETSINELIAVMNSIELKRIHLIFDHIGFFKKKNRYIVYMGPQVNEQLTQLAMNLQTALVEANLVKQEEFVYKPHVTLCRNAKLLIPSDNLSHEAKNKKEAIINNMTLYESSTINGILTYTPLYIREV